MAINRTLAWILAGGAALAIGGAAFWLWRRRVKARERNEQPEPQPQAPEGVEPDPTMTDEAGPQEPSPDEHPLMSSDAFDLEVQAAGFADVEAAANTAPELGAVITPTALADHHLSNMFKLVQQQWPTRPHGPELEPARGDDVSFVATGRTPDDKPLVELLIARIDAVRGDALDIEVVGSLSKNGLAAPAVGHGYAVGTQLQIDRRHTISIIKPAPRSTLVAKSRRKRYRVGAGELIELRPDTIAELPADSAWQPSRPDVAIRVVEQDESRSVVVLDGPAGDVNVALLTSAEGKSRTVCSWKFQIIEGAA